MALSGRRPALSILRPVRGRGEPPRPDEVKADGSPQMPKNFGDAEAKLWKDYISKAYWLTWVDTPKCVMWCHYQAQWERNPNGYSAPLLHQLRLLGTELGFDPMSRTRMGDGGKKKPKGPLEKFA